MIFVNLKTYKEGTGINAINLIKILEEVATLTQVKIIPVVQASDVREAVTNSKLEIWVQKIDSISYGAHTGAILPEKVLEDGAAGTFLNHSESKIGSLDGVKIAVERAKEVGLKTLVFAQDAEELSQVVNLEPTYVAYEPPELVGSTEVSVAQGHPDIVLKAVEIAKMKGIPLIVGAGIHSQEDVRKSVQMGATGIAVATYVVKSSDPRKSILGLAEGFK
jgi:triosephosphate isomerase